MRSGKAVFRRWRTQIEQPFRSAPGHQQRSDNVPAWSGQPHKADLSKNSQSMLLSATAKPSPDYEYRISLRPHPVGHPSSSTRDSASRAVPSLDTRQARRDGYREAAEWQQAEGDQRGRAAQKVFARAGSRKPRSDQPQKCSTTDNHGYRRLDDFAVGARPAISVERAAGGLCSMR